MNSRKISKYIYRGESLPKNADFFPTSPEIYIALTHNPVSQGKTISSAAGKVSKPKKHLTNPLFSLRNPANKHFLCLGGPAHSTLVSVKSVMVATRLYFKNVCLCSLPFTLAVMGLVVYTRLDCFCFIVILQEATRKMHFWQNQTFSVLAEKDFSMNNKNECSHYIQELLRHNVFFVHGLSYIKAEVHTKM